MDGIVAKQKQREEKEQMDGGLGLGFEKITYR